MEKDPRTIHLARRYLVPGETVLWAALQRGLGRRGLFVVGAVAFYFVAIWAITSLMGGPSLILLWLVPASPFLLWWMVEMVSRRFIATDRRVLFVSAVWPFRWSYWNYSEMDEHWVRFGKGRSIIHFRPFSRGTPGWVYNWAVYPTYVENVHDIESVRDLILAHIAQKPAPVEEEGNKNRKRRPQPPIHGTRTG